MKIDIISMPTFYGCDKKGVELGPKTLIKNNLLTILENCNHEISKISEIAIPSIDYEKKLSSNKYIKYFDEIIESSKSLSLEVSASLKSNNFPLILGGDHSLSIGSLSSISKLEKNIGIIWIDAHGDLNTHFTSPSKNAHGMPLALSLGYGHEKITSLFNKFIPSSNVFLFGIRSLDDGEKNFIVKNEMNLYDINSFKHMTTKEIVNSFKNIATKNNINEFHISFDIDVLDPPLVPGTGTPVKNGLDVETVKEFIDLLLSEITVCSLDFVEFNPILDKNSKTLDFCLDILQFLFRRINKK